tara:strand:- start:60 stop:647 length:588 start_codon:yes stop_codon:yes gene_type:complete
MIEVNTKLKSILDKITDIDGDIVELGVYTGNNSIQFMMQAPNRKYFGFDTFCGYTEEDIESSPNKQGLIDNGSRWNHSKEETTLRIKKSGLTSEFELVEGDLKETLPMYIKNKKIKCVSLLYVDCNAYLPSLKGIEAVYPIMPKGAIICIDEHLVGGETAALKEVAEKYNLDVIDTGFSFISTNYSSPSKYIIKQ